MSYFSTWFSEMPVVSFFLRYLNINFVLGRSFFSLPVKIRSSHRRCFTKNCIFLEMSQISQENTSVRVWPLLQNTSKRLLLKNVCFKWSCLFFYSISMFLCFWSNRQPLVGYNTSSFYLLLLYNVTLEILCREIRDRKQ